MTSFVEAFRGAKAFDQAVGDWDVAKVRWANDFANAFDSTALSGNDCLKSDTFFSWATMQKNTAFKTAYASWEKERSSGRLRVGRSRARDTDFFHGTCKNARLRLDAEAPADSKVAELEANNFALEEKMAALEGKLTAA